jgi:hypothetical protein
MTDLPLPPLVQKGTLAGVAAVLIGVEPPARRSPSVELSRD